MQSVFFLLRSVGRRDLSAGPEQKKNTTQGVFFLLRPRGKAREGEAPLEAGTGPEQKKTPPRVLFFLLREAPLEAGTGPEQKKKHQPGCVFFCSGPGERQGKEKPRWKPARGQSKKSFFFFALAPCRRPTGLLLPLPFPGAGAKKKHPGWCFFFCSGPVPASNGASPSLAFRRGRSKKKNTLGGVFFLLWPRAGFQRGFSFPCLSPGPQQKKKHPGWCFFFLLRPRADAHSLTAGLGGDASPSPGRCFFLLRPRPDRGGVFFLLWPRPDAHSLTVGWGDFGKARVVFFFLLRPRRVFLDNSKKCLGYYIGSKKTRRGHSKKKNTTSLKNLQGTPESGPKTLNP